jgi:phage baseplate assembly protein V
MSWENVALIGSICEIDPENRALVKVQIGDMRSDFLPVAMFANSFLRGFSPIRIGEQVMVISPFGEAGRGIVIRSIFNVDCKEPAGSNEHTQVFEYEDGTRISYDTNAKELRIDAAGSINIKATTTHIGNVTIEGNLEVVGNIHATGSIIDEGGNTNHHGH